MTPAAEWLCSGGRTAPLPCWCCAPGSPGLRTASDRRSRGNSRSYAGDRAGANAASSATLRIRSHCLAIVVNASPLRLLKNSGPPPSLVSRLFNTSMALSFNGTLRRLRDLALVACIVNTLRSMSTSAHVAESASFNRQPVLSRKRAISSRRRARRPRAGRRVRSRTRSAMCASGCSRRRCAVPISRS